MGGAVSSGENNDALVDNLVDADYIRTAEVERIFRAVDRAFYFTDEYKQSAYKDLAWKHGNLHLSAPCIYSQVMENLELKPGLSFLNLGSGTGYLSTMAGLVIGSTGINHGIEIHADVIEYAEERLGTFMKTCTALDEYDFCPPRFVHGNCLSLSSTNRRYDRVYCGAACPETYDGYMKHLLKVGGILVIPMNDQLLQIRRLSEESWDTKPALPVSFASLVQPRPDAVDDVMLPTVSPLGLQECCRSRIRSILRDAIDAEQPELWKRCRKNPKQKGSKTRLPYVLPVFEDSDSDHLTFEDPGNSSSESEEETPTSVSPTETDEGLGSIGQPERHSETDNGEDHNEPLDTTSGGVSDGMTAEDDNTHPTPPEETTTRPNPDRFRYFTRSLRDARGNAALVIIESRARRSPRGTKRRSFTREDEGIEQDASLVVDEKNFTYYMKKKIDALPVPFQLKLFLNHVREF